MSTSAVMILGERGRVVIPKEIREEQNWNPGDRLIIFQDEHGMSIMTRDQLEQRLYAGIKNPEISAVDSLIADRRAAALRDMEE